MEECYIQHRASQKEAFWASYVYSIYVLCPDTSRVFSEHLVHSIYALFPGGGRMYQLLCKFSVYLKSYSKIVSHPNYNLKITPSKRNNVTRYKNVAKSLANFWSCSKDSRCQSVTSLIDFYFPSPSLFSFLFIPLGTRI